MARTGLDSEEATVLAAAIGVIRDARLRKALAAEVWVVLQQHKSRWRPYDKAHWDKVCRVKG